MDYQVINCRDVDNLKINESEIIFDYNPTQMVNFFDSSLVVYGSFNIAPDGLDEAQKANIVKEYKGKIKLNRFYIYKIFKTIAFKEANADKYINNKVYDYVRMKNVYNLPTNNMTCFEDQMIDIVFGDVSYQYTIPLRYLFPEFEDLFYYSNERKMIEIHLNDLSKISDILDKSDKDYSIKITNFKIKNMLLRIPIKATLAIDVIPKQIGQAYRRCEMGELNISNEFEESTLPLRCDKRKPICFSFMLKNNKDRIITDNELINIQLQINNVFYPTYDMKLDTYNQIHYLYEMYMRYIDFYYHKKDNYSVHCTQSYYNIYNYKKHPVIFFILPQLPDDTSYEIYVSLKFKSDKKTKKLAYMYHYVDTINE
ncbi:hypothetical protein CBEVV_005 [Choristoneura biennis entomopoxvirus 'L' virophage]|nr:hypothetical protein CBEVV_005 [Choristoneura biennis entomopoxvirus 'L' virophage]